MKITTKLGDEVRDVVSGFRGIAVAEHNYLNGCTRFSVQPKIGEDGKLPDTATFDAPQLELVKKEVAPPGNRLTGGPEKFMPRKRPGE